MLKFKERLNVWDLIQNFTCKKKGARGIKKGVPKTRMKVLQVGGIAIIMRWGKKKLFWRWTWTPRLLARVGHHKVWRVRVRPSFTTSIVELEAHDWTEQCKEKSRTWLLLTSVLNLQYCYISLYIRTTACLQQNNHRAFLMLVDKKIKI